MQLPQNSSTTTPLHLHIIPQTRKNQHFQTLQPVTVSAEIVSENDKFNSKAFFTWDFGEGVGSERYTKIDLAERGVSRARHTYTTAGVYKVGVAASLGNETVLEDELEYSLEVMEAISGLRLKHVTGTYAAAFYPHVNQSEAVLLEATCVKGSNVKFRFEFGDNSYEEVAASYNVYTRQPEAYASHIYSREGTYFIELSAGNAVSNSTESVYASIVVQTPPSALKLEQRYYTAVVDEAVEFVASVGSGSNLTYFWTFGDTETIQGEGASVWKTLKKPGDTFVTVTARNRVAFQSVSANIFVDVPLRTVSLSCNCSKDGDTGGLIAASESNVLFTANEAPYARYYIFTVRKQTFGAALKTVNEFTSRPNVANIWFDSRGVYELSVTACNYITCVNSTKLTVRVEDAVQLGEVVHPGSAIAGEEFHVDIHVEYGSNFTVHCRIGNLSSNRLCSPQRGENPAVISFVFTFYEEGAYPFHFVISNAVSNITHDFNVFIVSSRICYPPDLKFLASSVTERKYAEESSFEVIVTEFDCDIAESLHFEWKILDADKNVVLKVAKSNSSTLTLPAKSLSFGAYTIIVRATITGSFIYGQTQSRFRIIPSGVEAIISGSQLKILPRSTPILLDASQSTDLDSAASNLQYLWQCNRLEQHSNEIGTGNKRCPKHLALSKSATFQFSTSDLTPGLYLFNLTVWKDDIVFNKRFLDSKFQILKILPDRFDFLNAEIECLSCRGKQFFIQDLILDGTCRNCDDKPIPEYRWMMWRVDKEVKNGAEKCLDGEGSQPEYVTAVPMHGDRTKLVPKYFQAPKRPKRGMHGFR